MSAEIAIAGALIVGCVLAGHFALKIVRDAEDERRRRSRRSMKQGDRTNG